MFVSFIFMYAYLTNSLRVLHPCQHTLGCGGITGRLWPRRDMCNMSDLCWGDGLEAAGSENALPRKFSIEEIR